MNTRAKKEKVEKKQLNIRTEYVCFRDIEESPINAQEMNESDFLRLVKNLKRDGVLTSAPLLMDQEGKNKKMCISGHYRIKAAIKAGIEGAICLISDELDESTRVRIQLTHNDIHGDPNMDIVALLQRQLTEFDISLIDISNLDKIISDAKEVVIDVPNFQYVNICLLEQSRERFVEMITTLGDAKAENYLITKPEYDKMKDLLSYAFSHGFKTAGQSIGKFMDIVGENMNEIKR